MELESTHRAQGRLCVGEVDSVIGYLLLIYNVSVQSLNQQTFSFPSAVTILLYC